MRVAGEHGEPALVIDPPEVEGLNGLALVDGRGAVIGNLALAASSPALSSKRALSPSIGTASAHKSPSSKSNLHSCMRSLRLPFKMSVVVKIT